MIHKHYITHNIHAIYMSFTIPPFICHLILSTLFCLYYYIPFIISLYFVYLIFFIHAFYFVIYIAIYIILVIIIYIFYL